MIKQINEGIFSIESRQPGETTVIMAGIHGDEISGINVIQKIIDEKITIDVISGRIYFIIANLEAIVAKRRFIDKDMNRSFIIGQEENTEEGKRVSLIKKILNTADYLLDIHNTSNENSEAFLISEYPEIGKFFNVKKFVSGFDKLHPGGSDGYMNQTGKVGICLECGNCLDNNAEMLAEKSILNFLNRTKNTRGKLEYFEGQENSFFDYIYKTQSNKFVLARNFADFDILRKGDLIGIDGTKKIYAKKNRVIVFSKNCYNKNEEAFVLGTETG